MVTAFFFTLLLFVQKALVIEHIKKFLCEKLPEEIIIEKMNNLCHNRRGTAASALKSILRANG
jgi:hypothetical protein